VQDIQVVYDKERLHTALRDGFNLSISFPVRWVISVKTQITGGQLKHSYSLFLVGHHIAVDGSSMSQLSKELLSKFSAGPDDTTTTSIVKAASYGDYIHEQVSATSN
jgi:hypothetical protein